MNKSAGLLSILLLLISTSNFSHAQENSYPIYCRKGGNMTMTLTNSKNGRLQMSIQFERSKTKFEMGKPSLKPGHCAYQTRPIYSSEPNIMTHQTDTPLSVKFSLGGDYNTKFSLSPTGMVRGGNFSNVAANRHMMRFISKLNNDEYFTVNAAKSGRGYYVITWFH